MAAASGVLVSGVTAGVVLAVAFCGASGDVGLAALQSLHVDSNSTVLYVEDNLSNVRLMEDIFAIRAGIKLVTAMQGQLGLDLAREHRPDLIFLDLHLPDLSGDQVLAGLRSDPRTRTIPVIMISADATSSQMQRLLDAGAAAYLTKPLDVEELLAIIDTVCGATDLPAIVE